MKMSTNGMYVPTIYLKVAVNKRHWSFALQTMDY